MRMILFSIVITTALFTNSLFAQDVAVDKKPGIGELMVGAKITPLIEKLGLEMIVDPMLGEPVHVFKDFAGSSYSKFQEVIEVENIQILEEGGIIYEVRMTFPDTMKLSKVRNAFADYFDVRLMCAVGVDDPESGGCYLDGEKYSFSLDNMDWEKLTASFSEADGY